MYHLQESWCIKPICFMLIISNVLFTTINPFTQSVSLHQATEEFIFYIFKLLFILLHILCNRLLLLTLAIGVWLPFSHRLALLILDNVAGLRALVNKAGCSCSETNFVQAKRLKFVALTVVIELETSPSVPPCLGLCVQRRGHGPRTTSGRLCMPSTR